VDSCIRNPVRSIFLPCNNSSCFDEVLTSGTAAVAGAAEQIKSAVENVAVDLETTNAERSSPETDQAKDENDN